MTLAMLMLMGPIGPADAVFDRYASWMGKHPGYAVQGSAASPGMKKPVAFDLRIQRPSSVAYRARLNETDFRLVKTAKGQIETEAATRMYDEQPGSATLRIWPTNLTGLVEFSFPGWLLPTSIRGVFPGTPTLEKTTLDGKAVELVHATAKDGPSTYDAWGWFAPNGTPAKVRLKSVSPMGATDTTWNFAAFGALPASSFALTIPGNYSPYRLPGTNQPVAVGEPIRLGTWERGGKSVDLDGQVKGTALVAVLTPGAAPTTRLAPALAALEKGGMKVLRLCDGTNDPTMFRDPKGTRLDDLGLPGTPYVFLVKGGKVAGAWFGADKGNQAFLNEVHAAAKE